MRLVYVFVQKLFIHLLSHILSYAFHGLVIDLILILVCCIPYVTYLYIYLIICFSTLVFWLILGGLDLGSLLSNPAVMDMVSIP